MCACTPIPEHSGSDSSDTSLTPGTWFQQLISLVIENFQSRLHYEMNISWWRSNYSIGMKAVITFPFKQLLTIRSVAAHTVTRTDVSYISCEHSRPLTSTSLPLAPPTSHKQNKGTIPAHPLTTVTEAISGTLARTLQDWPPSDVETWRMSLHERKLGQQWSWNQPFIAQNQTRRTATRSTHTDGHTYSWNNYSHTCTSILKYSNTCLVRSHEACLVSDNTRGH